MTISISILAIIFLLLLVGFMTVLAAHSAYSHCTRGELPSWVTELGEILLEVLHRVRGPHYLFLDHFELSGEHEGKKSWFWKKPPIYLFPPKDIFIFIRLEKIANEYIDEIQVASKRKIGSIKVGARPDELSVEVPVPLFDMKKNEARLLGAMSRKALRNGWKIEKIEVPRVGHDINLLRYKFLKKRGTDF